MKRLIISILGAALIFAPLAACETVKTVADVAAVSEKPVGDQAIADSRNAIYGIRALYNAALRAAVEYSRLPSCTPPDHPAVCSSDDLVRSMATIHVKASRIIDASEKTVLSNTADTKVRQAAVAAARAAYNEFKALTDQTTKGAK